MSHPLDNPIYNALTGRDAPKNIGNQKVAFFSEEIAPFLGMPNWKPEYQQEVYHQISKDRRWILLIKDQVQLLKHWEIERTFTIYQMVWQGEFPKATVETGTSQIIPLDLNNVDEMLSLTELTRPGPFMKRTIEFGNYHGIFELGRLIAMGGERMHVKEYTEISAICAHPDYQGLGYGAQITGYLTRMVIAQGRIPFLHVLIENERAIKTYQRLGFEIREALNGYVFSADIQSSFPPFH